MRRPEAGLYYYGCAGSGKTMLAVEQAKRLAAKGEDVLFVCFNTGLKNHLREREASSGVEFWNFHLSAVTWRGSPESSSPPIRRTRRLRSTSPMSCHSR